MISDEDIPRAAAGAHEACLAACAEFEGDFYPDLEPRDARAWWAETYQHHPEELASRIRAFIELSRPTPSGCLILSQGDTGAALPRPERVYWRGRRQKVYQLVAWGLSGELPTKRSVVRHLCDNRMCISPAHLKIGTQAQNLMDQRISRSKRWAHP